MSPKDFVPGTVEQYGEYIRSVATWLSRADRG